MAESKKGIPVVARVRLIGDGQDTLPGATHYVATRAEAEKLVARDAARWPDDPPARVVTVNTTTGAEEVE